MKKMRKDENKDENKNENKDENKDEKNFSKNSIMTLAKKAGATYVSQEGIDKINEILNEKIKYYAERLSIFCSTKNGKNGKHGKTINKKLIIKFLESEGIHMIDNESIII